MTDFLLRKFIRDYLNTGAPEVRAAYGRFAGTLGIVMNGLLAVMKGLLGYFSGSIAIVADAVNNLSDSVSSLITLIGFKLAAKEKDAEHPYGHARIEYMTGIVIAAFIILIGFKLFSDSYRRIIQPEPVQFGILTVVLLVIAIAVKLWQSFLYFNLAKRIRSVALRATGTDSRNDVIATSAVLAALVIGRFSGVNVDGYMGAAVALFILWSGIKLIRETSRPLLGQAPDPDLVKRISEMIDVRKAEGVMGFHDLVVHDYGPGRTFASVHIEVDATEDILISHELIDDIEREIMSDLRVELVAHMDPVDTTDPLVSALRNHFEALLPSIEDAVGIHDLRIVRGEQRINVIFDVVLSADAHPRTQQGSAGTNSVRQEEILEVLRTGAQKIDERCELVVTFDTDYTGTL